jgi:hypothetical protein
VGTTTNEKRLEEMRGRIDALESSARGAEGEMKSRLQRALGTLRQQESSARAAAASSSDEADDRLEQLKTRVGIAEKDLKADMAQDRAAYTKAVHEELRDWDAFVDRMQVKAAQKTGEGRRQAEAEVTEVRQYRHSVDERLSDLRASSGDKWREQKARVVAALDRLEKKADEWSTGSD